MGEKILSFLQKALVYLILFYMMIPIFILFIVAFNSDRYFSFPPKQGMGLVHFIGAFQSEEYRSAVQTSLMVAASAIVIGLFVGILAAFAIDRYEFKGKNLMQGFFLSPLLLPTIIWAIGLVSFYATLHASGTFIGLALAHGVLVTPYVVRLILASLSYININVENAAKSLGASPTRTFFEITIPLISPGILVSAMFGFTISFTDLVIATFIAGSRLITFPARIYYEQRTEGLDPLAVAVSAIVMTVIIIIALVGERTVKWSRFI
jgi:putative spermidine/putrescine transport system permease protein